MDINTNIKKIVITSLMSALCFVGAYISIPVALPFGSAIIHFGNIFMIVAALVFGKVIGGLSAGIGMFLFDIFSGTFLMYAPGTFIVKFISGFICGKIAFSDRNFKNRYLFASIVGISINIILSPFNSIAVNMFSNNFQIVPLIMSAFGTFFISILNGIIAIVVALPISKIIIFALKNNNSKV